MTAALDGIRVVDLSMVWAGHSARASSAITARR